MAAHNEALVRQLARLTEQVEKLQRMLFGARSEKMPPISRELKETPTTTVDGQPMPSDRAQAQHERDRLARAKSEAERQERSAKRKQTLPVQEIVISVADNEIPSGMTRGDFRAIGTASPVERIAYLPARFVRLRYLRETLVHRQDDSLVLTASLPAGAVEGSIYDASVYAHVVVSRCMDSHGRWS